jgi:hypothetical protein
MRPNGGWPHDLSSSRRSRHARRCPAHAEDGDRRRARDAAAVRTLFAVEAKPQAVTLGQFYAALDELLKSLPASDWRPSRNQIVDDQFFAGQLFAINGGRAQRDSADRLGGRRCARRPARLSARACALLPLRRDLSRQGSDEDANPLGYAWGPQRLGVDWGGGVRRRSRRRRRTTRPVPRRGGRLYGDAGRPRAVRFDLLAALLRRDAFRRRGRLSDPRAADIARSGALHQLRAQFREHDDRRRRVGRVAVVVRENGRVADRRLRFARARSTMQSARG